MNKTKEEVRKDFLISVGEVIRTKRKKKNISQQELGDFLELTKSAVCKYEKGEVDMPISVLPLVSNYCDFPMIDYFYDEKVQMSAKYFVMLQEIIEGGKENSLSETLSESTAIESEKYEEVLKDITAHLAKESSEKAVNVLYSAGQLIEIIQVDNEELARELSKQVLNYIYSIGQQPTA